MERQRGYWNAGLIGVCLLLVLILARRGGGPLLLVLLAIIAAAASYIAVIGIWRSRKDQQHGTSQSDALNAAETSDATYIPVPVPKRSRKGRRIRQTDRAILALAVQSEGYLTAADVALRTDLTLDEASASLERIRHNGHATLRIAGNGTYVYHFGGILTEEEKRQSERV